MCVKDASTILLALDTETFEVIKVQDYHRDLKHTDTITEGGPLIQTGAWSEAGWGLVDIILIT